MDRHPCAKTVYIMPGSSWENEWCESFNLKLCDELLDCENFHALKGALIGIEVWRQYHSTVRPNLSLGYKPRAPEASPWPAARSIIFMTLHA